MTRTYADYTRTNADKNTNYSRIKNELNTNNIRDEFDTIRDKFVDKNIESLRKSAFLSGKHKPGSVLANYLSYEENYFSSLAPHQKSARGKGARTFLLVI